MTPPSRQPHALTRPVPRSLRPARGVSLVEALVALAVMSFGMLALVGVQATLRHNSDAARERTEAMRLAAEDAEALRGFGSLDQLLVPGIRPWDLVSSRTNATVSLPISTGITTRYTLDRQVATFDDPVPGDARFQGVQLKTAEVKVSWTDRIGNAYGAVLDNVVSGVAPALSARLVLPVATQTPSRSGSRHASIPVSARDLGNGKSALKPFNQGSTAYVIDNATGFVTSLCSGVAASQTQINLGDVTGPHCATLTGRLLTGTVRYDLSSTAPHAGTSENPPGPNVLPLDPSTPLGFAANSAVNHSGTPVCHADNPATPADAGSSAAPRSRIDYICVLLPNSLLGWGGQINLVPGNFPDGSPGNWALGTGSGQYKVCRYTTASTDYTANTDHPRTYCKVNSTGLCDTGTNSSGLVRNNLSHQNFLVIRAPFACPSDVAANPSSGDLVNSNTLAHQP